MQLRTPASALWPPILPQHASLVLTTFLFAADVLKETQPSVDVVGDAVTKKKKLGKRISQSFKVGVHSRPPSVPLLQ